MPDLLVDRGGGERCRQGGLRRAGSKIGGAAGFETRFLACRSSSIS
jgi:hypothetical protein